MLSTNGDTHLGGDDFDQRLIDFVADEFRKQEGIDIREDAMALQRLKEACEKAKCELSQQVETAINLPFITADQNGPKHLQLTVTRSKFESLCEDMYARVREPCMKALADAKLQASDVAEVVLVGGSTRMPKVQEIAKEVFAAESLDKSINPDEVVAIGAAIQGGVLQGDVKDVLLLRRDTALARCGDARRRDDHADPEEHDDPDVEEGDLLDGIGQSDVRDHSRAAG